MPFAALALLCLPSPQAEPKEAQDVPFLIHDIRSWLPGKEPSPARSWFLHDGRLERVQDFAAARRAHPEAEVIEAEPDWLLYPGMVHAAFPAQFVDLPPNAYAQRSTDPTTGPIPAMEYGDHRNLRTWIAASDFLEWDPSAAEAWRRVGFTAAQVLPQRGLLRGHAAMVLLNGRLLGDALLLREGREVLSLRGLRGGYPQTPMASLAVLRQVLLDGERAAESHSNKESSPDLRRVSSSIFLANGSREIENVLDLLRDYAPEQRALILGGREAWKHCDRLRERGVGVLYRLDLPDAPKTDEELGVKEGAERPAWQAPAALRAERRREHALRVAGFRKLKEAGVACALVPSSDWKKTRKALAQLREDGLSDDQLYRALSVDVVSLLSYTPLLTMIRGDDLVISRGPYDFDDPALAWVFLDGRGWEFPAPTTDEGNGEKEDAQERNGAKGGGPGGETKLVGDWRISLDTPMGQQVFGVELDSGKGTVRVFDPEEPAERAAAEGVRYRGNGVHFQFTPPDFDLLLKVEMEIEGNSGSGTIDTPMGSLPFEAEPLDADEAAERQGGGNGSEEQGNGDLGHPEWPVETRAMRLPIHDLQGSVLLRAATLYPVTGEAPRVGDLLIRDGKIAAIGSSLSAPEGVPVLDLQGLHLIPGIIDPHSHLALDAINEGSVAISAECRIGDMIHPESLSIYRAAAGGTTLAQALHGSANPIGGQTAVWELDWTRPRIADLLYPDAPRGIKFALGENVKQSNWQGAWGKRFPNTRMGVQTVYREAFTAAQDYLRRRALHERGRLPSFRRDLRLETLADVLEGKIRVQCHSYRADEILMFLGIVQEFGLKPPVFQHVLEGYKVAPELAAAGAMASTFSDWWAYKYEVIDAIPWNVALLHEAGVVTSINSDSDEMIRRLNTEAGKSQRYGELSVEECLKLCTLDPAIQLGIDDHLGTLEVGKDGTVSVYDGPPLSTYSRCVLSLARGRVLFEHRPEQDRVWADYLEKVQAFAARLAAKEAPAEEAQAEEGPHENDADAWEPWIRNGLGQAVLIRNARLHPVSAPPFEGALLAADGRIQWLGPVWEGRLPEGCLIVDARGRDLYPGFLDAGDVTGIFEIGEVRSARDDLETGQDHPDLSVASAIHADSRHIRITRMTGITHVLVRPRKGRIRGQAALIQLDGTSSSEMVVVPDLGLTIAFPRVARPKEGKAPKDPDGAKELDQWLDRALAYGERRARVLASGFDLLERNPRLEALLPYARGEKPVFLECADALTLMAARKWARQHHIDAIYVPASESWKVAGYFAADRARMVLGPVHALPHDRYDPYDAPFRAPGLLARAGCTVALQTDDPEVTRDLPFEAATAASAGWSKEGALRALTLDAARVLGVDRYVGSLEVGKAADFFLSDGDPLDFPGTVRRLWIGGKEVELNSAQTELRDRYRKRIRSHAPSPREKGNDAPRG